LAGSEDESIRQFMPDSALNRRKQRKTCAAKESNLDVMEMFLK